MKSDIIRGAGSTVLIIRGFKFMLYTYLLGFKTEGGVRVLLERQIKIFGVVLEEENTS